MAILEYFPFLAPFLPASMRPAGPRFVTESGAPLAGIVGEFDEVSAVYHAAEQIRDAGYQKWDLHSPFPIHGVEDAMGMKRTKLPFAVAAGGLTGAALGFLMQWWMSGVDYQIVVQGKPYGAWQAFIPITFEFGVLGTAFTALIGMFMLNGLPRHSHPLMNLDRFLRSSDDRFFIYIETADAKFDPDSTRTLLESTGATHIELVEDA